MITSYCNAYCGYITTYQEYQSQCYEGGHTVFGEHTLGAFQTKYKQLAIEMTKPFNNRKQLKIDQPTSFSEEELSKRSFNIRTQKRLIQIDD